MPEAELLKKKMWSKTIVSLHENIWLIVMWIKIRMESR